MTAIQRHGLGHATTNYWTLIESTAAIVKRWILKKRGVFVFVTLYDVILHVRISFSSILVFCNKNYKSISNPVFGICSRICISLRVSLKFPVYYYVRNEWNDRLRFCEKPSFKVSKNYWSSKRMHCNFSASRRYWTTIISIEGTSLNVNVQILILCDRNPVKLSINDCSNDDECQIST